MSVSELATLVKLRRIGLVRVVNLTDQAVFALSERQSSLERIHLSYCEQVTIPAIHFLLQRLHKLTHLSLTGIPAFRREELQRFCRTPPRVSLVCLLLSVHHASQFHPHPKPTCFLNVSLTMISSRNLTLANERHFAFIRARVLQTCAGTSSTLAQRSMVCVAHSRRIRRTRAMTTISPNSMTLSPIPSCPIPRGRTFLLSQIQQGLQPMLTLSHLPAPIRTTPRPMLLRPVRNLTLCMRRHPIGRWNLARPPRRS